MIQLEELEDSVWENPGQKLTQVYEVLKNVEDTKTNFSKKFTPENNDDRVKLEEFFGSVDSVIEKYSSEFPNCVLPLLMMKTAFSDFVQKYHQFISDKW